MKCKYCKKEIEQAQSCPFCGRSQVSGFKTMPKRYFICLAVLFAAFIIAAAVFSYNMRPDPYIDCRESVLAYEDGDNTLFFVNGKYADKFFGKISSEQYVKGTCTFISDGVLYRVNKKGIEQIASDISHFTVSANSKKIAYINTVGELYLWSGKSKSVDYNVIASNLCISDNGALAYVKQETSGDVLYTYNSGTPKRIGQSLYPVSVSGGAKVIYCTDESSNLYCLKNGKETLIADNVDADSLFVNNDHSQILYYSGGSTYLFRGKGDAITVASEKCEIARIGLENDTNYSSGAASVLGIRSFCDKLYLSETGDLIKLRKNGDASHVDSGVSSVLACENGKNFLYLKDDTLIRVRFSNLKKKEMASSVSDFSATSDGRYLFYTSQEGADGDNDALYVKYANRSPKLLSSDCISFTLFTDERCQFISADHALHAVNGTGKVNDIASDITLYKSSITNAVYAADSSIYYGNGSNKIKKIEK